MERTEAICLGSRQLALYGRETPQRSATQRQFSEIGFYQLAFAQGPCQRQVMGSREQVYMIRKLRDAGRITVPAKNGSRLLTANQTEAVNVQDAQGRFDPEAWTAVLEEQRLCIAAAAGVDPSKVRFHIGH